MIRRMPLSHSPFISNTNLKKHYNKGGFYLTPTTQADEQPLSEHLWVQLPFLQLVETFSQTFVSVWSQSGHILSQVGEATHLIAKGNQ